MSDLHGPLALSSLPRGQPYTLDALQVTVKLDEVQGSGVAWLEAERDGFMSPALPVVLCEDPDIVEELRTLEGEVADGRYMPLSLNCHRLIR